MAVMLDNHQRSQSAIVDLKSRLATSPLYTYINAPDRMPAPPKPATALPPIKVGEFLERAHIRDPPHTKPIHIKNIVLGLNVAYSLPIKGCVAPVTSRLQ